MLWSRKIALVLLAGLTTAPLGACGFSPVYGAHSSVGKSLNDVAITSMEGRVGQAVRNTLIEELTPNGSPSAPNYFLDLKVNEDLNPLAIKRDASVTRFDYKLDASFSLRDSKTSEVLFSDTTQIITSANRLDQSEFASVIGVDDAKLRAARAIGQDIARRLAAYFARQENVTR